MTNKVGIRTLDTLELAGYTVHLQTLMTDFETQNNKLLDDLEAMESKYIEKKMEEIDAIEREMKQLGENVNQLISSLIQIGINYNELDIHLSNIKEWKL